MSEISFTPNPFIHKARYYEAPKTIIPGHWVTKEFGFEVFNSANMADAWIYIKVDDKTLFKATEEFLHDKTSARVVFANLQA